MRPGFRPTLLAAALALAFVVLPTSIAVAAPNAPLEGTVEASRDGSAVTLTFLGFGAGPRHVAVTFLERGNVKVLTDEFDQMVPAGAVGSDTFSKTYRLPDDSNARGFAIVTGPEGRVLKRVPFEYPAPIESDDNVAWVAWIAGAVAVLAIGTWLYRRRLASVTEASST